ncbi:malonyl-CoA decarboxylase, mitochondrial [Frankliniella occidentalis]|uniref:Malonyl-CoA decarboxylase, mitochondrial n=1 Tax=Frankliniella occidentalis TaxID=133901 RepID=A0A9C6X591_FRAOC|nr:malonyl-CoA decarboxylase, mitochondrial [Frankliniella occidentalis]
MMISRRLSHVHNLNLSVLELSLSSSRVKSTLAPYSEHMSSRESDGWRFFNQILGFSGVNSRFASRSSASPSPGASQSHSDDDSPAYYFGATEKSNNFRRESTVDDEARVVALLKEILAYQDTNMSNWIIESKVKSLCAAYSYLLKPHKEGFLKVLACDYAIDHNAVRKAAEQMAQLEEERNLSKQFIKLEEKLKNSLTAQYSWLFMHVGRLERGVKFLVDLRTDVLDLISQLDPFDQAVVPMQRLNSTLRELLSMWFSVGFLAVERVTWKSPCEMLQKISEYEAVHPVRSWTDLKRRVGLYRRCFVYTHNSMPDEPIVVLHIALCDEISSSMAGIVAAASRLSVDTSIAEIGLPGVHQETEDPALVKAAVFYSITSTQQGLKGIELGNYLIKRAAEELQAEFPQVTQFSTLSPIPGFRSWLNDKLKAADKNEDEVLSPDEGTAIQKILGEKWPTELQRLLKSNAWLDNPDLVAFLKEPLMRMCARYLYLEKHRSAALNGVANFHLKNGAVMWRINWHADLSPRGLGNSCGIMVNYRYYLEDTEANSRSYLEHHKINASEQVIQLAASAERLSVQLTSKM